MCLSLEANITSHGRKSNQDRYGVHYNLWCMLYTSQHIDLSLPHLVYPNKWQNISASLKDRLSFKHKLKKRLKVITCCHQLVSWQMQCGILTNLNILVIYIIHRLSFAFIFLMASKSTEMWKHHLWYWIHFHSLKHQTCETATMKVGRVVEG